MDDKSEEKIVSLKFPLSESLRNRFKAACALKGLHMTDLLQELVEKWTDEYGPKELPPKGKK